MNNNRILILVTAIVSIAVVALGYLLAISPLLAAKAEADSQLQTVTSLNQQYAADLQQLEEQFNGIDDVRATLEDLRVTLPADGAYPAFLRELEALIAENGATLTSISVSTPVVYGSTTAADSTAGSDPISGGTLIALPLAISLSGSEPGALITLVHQLQEGERLFSVSNFKFVTFSVEGIYSLQLNGYIYSLLDPNAVVNDVPIVEEPTPEPTPTPTAPTETPTAATTP